jgi:hypothetical protein
MRLTAWQSEVAGWSDQVKLWRDQITKTTPRFAGVWRN